MGGVILAYFSIFYLHATSGKIEIKFNIYNYIFSTSYLFLLFFFFFFHALRIMLKGIM